MYVDPWGTVFLDKNTPGVETVKIKYTYERVTYFSNEFKVNVSCLSYPTPPSGYEISRLFHRYQTTFGRTNEIVRDYITEISLYLSFEKCLYCFTNKKFQFL